MIEYYIEYHVFYGSDRLSESCKPRVEREVEEYMNKLFKSINLSGIKLSEFNERLIELSRKSPTMNGVIRGEEFRIDYSKYVTIRFRNSAKQIYRNIKIKI